MGRGPLSACRFLLEGFGAKKPPALRMGAKRLGPLPVRLEADGPRAS